MFSGFFVHLEYSNDMSKEKQKKRSSLIIKTILINILTQQQQ